MKYKDLIKKIEFNKEVTIQLDKIYPIIPLDDSKYEVTYLIKDEPQEIFNGSYYAEKVFIKSETEKEVSLLLGNGYLSETTKYWDELFVTDGLWQGGDGIFSFNLDNGNDQFDQEKVDNTLLVFGDTFVGRFERDTERRLKPHLMPNNSLAYIEGNKLDFRLNTGKKGNIKAFYEMNEEYDYKGPIPRNLVSYDTPKPLMGYLSGYNPEKIELVFDLFKSRYITHIDFYNYFSQESLELAKRGFKDIDILTSENQETWNHLLSVSLEMAKHDSFKQTIQINNQQRYFKIICNNQNGIGNHNDKEYQEGLFGLNKLMFFENERQYKDLDVFSNTVLEIDREHSWIWLQDGVVIGDNLYFLPLVITGDETQPEGLQFKVLGVSLFNTPIKNGKIETHKSTQKMSPLYVVNDESHYFFGAACMANTIQAGAKNPDGFVYVYGYKTTLGLREMIVARVKAEDFDKFDEWQYFNGQTWSYNILDSKPLLPHISCEMSVSPILKGKNKGKYIAVFTYDVNTEYVAFSIGDSPVGPFTKPQKIYKTPEQDIFKSTTYTYNAKAHPHLSESKKILVSYNTNTYNFDHNMSNRLIYGPRFIYLNEIEE